MNPITEYTLNSLDNTNLDHYSLHKSKDNKNIVQINKDDKNIFLGSKYSVERDINKFITDIGEIDDETVLIVFGLGTGEHILKLTNMTKYNQILIIEPDNSVISIFNQIEYSNKILKNERIILCNCDESIINSGFLSLIKDYNISNTKIAAYSNYDKIYEKEYNNFMKSFLKYIKSCTYNMNTQMIFSTRLVEQFFENMKNIKRSIAINSIKNIYKGFPAVIVSGGPSLNKNIELLKKIKDRFVIIACSRTLKALLSVDVEPDFVCTIDPGEFSVEFVKEINILNSILCFAEVSNAKTVNLFKGEKVFFGEKMNFYDTIEQIIDYDIDSLWQGGSVAHTCTSLAEYIGCSTIIFIGQDLAYTDSKYHADIVNFSKGSNVVEERKDMLLVDDIYGNKVSTNKQLDFYRIKFEEHIQPNKNVRYINSTEGGANIKGTEVMRLENSMELFNGMELNKTLKKEKLKSIKKSFGAKTIINNLNKLKEFLEEIKKDCNNGIEYSKKIVVKKDGSVDKKVIKNFDKIKKINEQIQKIYIINSLFEPVIYKILMNKKFKFNLQDNNTEKVLKIKLQTEAMYNGAIKSIEYILPLIENAIKETEDGGKNE